MLRFWPFSIEHDLKFIVSDRQLTLCLWIPRKYLKEVNVFRLKQSHESWMDKTRYFHCSAAVLTASCSPALALTSPTLPQCPRVPTQTPHRLHPPTRHTDTTFQLPATIHETRDRRHGVWGRWPIESCQRTFSKFHSPRTISLLKAPFTY